MPHPRVDLEEERAALARARKAVEDKLERISTITGGGADAVTEEYIAAVVQGTTERLQRELVTFGRIDDDRPWRVGIYGIDDRAGDQLVIDWRTPFAARFYQASFDDPQELARRVSYVGCIDDLFVEEFASGEVSGSSPLMAELARHRGDTMRAAVATLQSDQDALVRLPPTARLVLRGGPGTGKTVVGLHRAAWLVYNDNRITADRILVLGPSDRFLRFIATVLPTLGESRVLQTTFDRLLGPSTPAGSDEIWLDALDLLEDSLLAPAALKVGRARLKQDAVEELVERYNAVGLPWRDRRGLFVRELARLGQVNVGEAGAAAKAVWASCTTRQAWARIRRRSTLVELGLDADLIDAWLAEESDGALLDEVRARFEGVPAKYSHVLVDEAQDLTLLQLRAVLRRSDGLTLVGDDAQRSNPDGIGLRRAAELVGEIPAVMNVAYRMSAEIADWLNAHADEAGLDAVRLDGIRPTGRPVHEVDAAAAPTVEAELRERWPNLATIAHGEVWEHKGVEYDAVVVDARGMDPAEVYLAASRAAHELAVVS